jgi:hypothetical protein
MSVCTRRPPSVRLARCASSVTTALCLKPEFGHAPELGWNADPEDAQLAGPRPELARRPAYPLPIGVLGENLVREERAHDSAEGLVPIVVNLSPHAAEFNLTIVQILAWAC